MSAPTHAEQKRAAVEESLIRAGIGKRYHRRSLREVAPEDVIEWASHPTDHVPAGEGWTFLGTGKAYDTLVLLARAVHLQGYGSLVVTLPKLVSLIEHPPENDPLERVALLGIVSFYEGPKPEMPLRGWQVAAVESYLVDRLDAGKSVCLQMSRPLDQQAFWSATLASRLESVNETVVIR